jgi:hypothetical protein
MALETDVLGLKPNSITLLFISIKYYKCGENVKNID